MEGLNGVNCVGGTTGRMRMKHYMYHELIIAA